jgi:hypothetical protein
MMEKKTNLNVKVMIDKTFEAFGRDNIQKIVSLLANFALNYHPEELSYSHITYEGSPRNQDPLRRGNSAFYQATQPKIEDKSPVLKDKKVPVNTLAPSISLKKAPQDPPANIMSLMQKAQDKHPKLNQELHGDDSKLTSFNLVVPQNRDGPTSGGAQNK